MPDLILRDDQTLSCSLAASAIELKEAALIKAAPIMKVTDETSQRIATEALSEINAVLKAVEDARVKVKQPVLDLCRKIDATAKEFVEELKAEQLRLNCRIGDYVTEQRTIQMRKEAEERLRLKEIEDAKQRELAQAKTVEEVKAAEERAVQAAETVAPVAPIAKPKNLVVRETFDFEVTDIHLLARMHPGLVKIEPVRSEINYLISKGVRDIKGLRIFEVTKVTARAATQPKAIEV